MLTFCVSRWYWSRSASQDIPSHGNSYGGVLARTHEVAWLCPVQELPCHSSGGHIHCGQSWPHWPPPRPPFIRPDETMQLHPSFEKALLFKQASSDSWAKLALATRTPWVFGWRCHYRKWSSQGVWSKLSWFQKENARWAREQWTGEKAGLLKRPEKIKVGIILLNCQNPYSSLNYYLFFLLWTRF